jgi:hypothetical protein
MGFVKFLSGLKDNVVENCEFVLLSCSVHLQLNKSFNTPSRFCFETRRVTHIVLNFRLLMWNCGLLLCSQQPFAEFCPEPLNPVFVYTHIWDAFQYYPPTRTQVLHYRSQFHLFLPKSCMHLPSASSYRLRIPLFCNFLLRVCMLLSSRHSSQYLPLKQCLRLLHEAYFADIQSNS